MSSVTLHTLGTSAYELLEWTTRQDRYVRVLIVRPDPSTGIRRRGERPIARPDGGGPIVQPLGVEGAEVNAAVRVRRAEKIVPVSAMQCHRLAKVHNPGN